jgi:hypothetical protein
MRPVWPPDQGSKATDDIGPIIIQHTSLFSQRTDQISRCQHTFGADVSLVSDSLFRGSCDAFSVRSCTVATHENRLGFTHFHRLRQASVPAVSAWFKA